VKVSRINTATGRCQELLLCAGAAYQLSIDIECSPYSITERKIPELIPVLSSQLQVSHKPGGRLPLLSVRPAVTLLTLKRADTNFAAW